MMYCFRFYFLIIFFICGDICAAKRLSLLYTDFNAHDLVLIKEWEVKRSYIALVKDSTGKKYIIKQSKEGQAKGEIFCIREVVAAYMAEILGVPANVVRLIPAGVAVVGKKYPDRVATMHVFVEGIHWSKVRRKFEGAPFFTLKQRYSRAASEAERGLTLVVLKSMALHATLPLIVALDSFIGLSGRNSRNLLYQEDNDAFYAIDFDTGFARDLCVWASMRLREIFENNRDVLEKKDFQALVLYKKTLEKIVHLLTPEVVRELFSTALNASRIADSREAKKLVERYIQTTDESYASANTLIDLLKDFLVMYNKKLGFYH
jgi:hypothetical protein